VYRRVTVRANFYSAGLNLAASVRPRLIPRERPYPRRHRYSVAVVKIRLEACAERYPELLGQLACVYAADDYRGELLNS